MRPIARSGLPGGSRRPPVPQKPAYPPVHLKLRALVIARARGYCELCGEEQGEEIALHYRRQRGRHGTPRFDGNCAPNLMAVHLDCIDRLVARQPAQAEVNGWTLTEIWDPVEVPVLIPQTGMRFLTADGRYRVNSVERQVSVPWERVAP